MEIESLQAPADYELVAAQCASCAEGERHWLPVLANVSAVLAEALADVNWVGFYLTAAFVDKCLPADELVLGPFQGKLACVHIPYGRGVCGTAAEKDATQLVPDVHAFAGHIACDATSRSEVVVPLHACGAVVGVLDIDSPSLARFDERDRAGLEACVRALERTLWPQA